MFETNEGGPQHGEPALVPFEERLFTVRQTRQVLPIGNTKVYDLIGSKRLDARKIDGRTVITGASIKALIESLPKAAVIAA